MPGCVIFASKFLQTEIQISRSLTQYSFLGLLLSETAAPRTLEFLWVFMPEPTPLIFNPFHFTRSHRHVGATFEVLFFPIQLLTVFLPSQTEKTQPPTTPRTAAISFKLLNCAKLQQFFLVGGERDLATLPRSKHLIFSLRRLRCAERKQVRFAHFYYFWRSIVGKQTRLKFPRAARPDTHTHTRPPKHTSGTGMMQRHASYIVYLPVALRGLPVRQYYIW